MSCPIVVFNILFTTMERNELAYFLDTLLLFFRFTIQEENEIKVLKFRLVQKPTTPVGVVPIVL